MIKKTLVLLLVWLAIAVQAQDEKEKSLIDSQARKEYNTPSLMVGETALSKTVMQDYAGKEEQEALLSAYPKDNFLLFPERRENSIRLLDGIPSIWARRTKEELTSIQLSAQPGEYFVFQIGIWAARADLSTIRYSASPFTGSPALGELSCFNLEGTDFRGQELRKEIDVKQGDVQALWFGVQIPESATGKFTTEIDIGAEDEVAKAVHVTLEVSGKAVRNKGFDDSYNMSRLAWLNSMEGRDDDLTSGYLPVQREKHGYKILGREVSIADNGLPASILSYFDNNNQSLASTPEAILKDKLKFVVELAHGETVLFEPGELEFLSSTPSQLVWELISHASNAILKVRGSAEFDGFINYEIELTARESLAVKDIRLEVPFTSAMSKYMMGMGKTGGYRPDSWSWTWDVAEKGQDGVWIGGLNGGLKIKLKDQNYRRPLVNIYYPFHPLLLPESWGNENKGGAEIIEDANETLLTLYSGARTMQANQSLFFNCEMLITPFKLINKDVQFNDRYFHTNMDNVGLYIPDAKKSGANIINIHQGNEIYPYINYPYITENIDGLARFIEDAHAEGIRTKVYYTTRELTVNAPEIWAMRSLKGEIILPGPGKDVRTVIHKKGPDQWLLDNFKSDFIPAWVSVFKEGPYEGLKDLSVITTPDSRLNNFFIGGLDWMCDNLKIDGFYIDDAALDRETLRRARKIVDRRQSTSRIDMHTWDHFNSMAGYICCMNLYMDLLPYIDMMWIGESRNYNASPDYWLVETSGIPFGLTSQMLNRGGNKWRGMVYGMTNRLGWLDPPTPEYIWKFWDEHEIQAMNMIGFWDENCPVSTNNSEMVATVYKGAEKSIIAVANWTDKDITGKLEIDWDKLGLEAENSKIYIPAIGEYQDARQLKLSSQLTIEGGKGFLIIIEGR